MREKIISVIVPIYKVEKYLNRCIDSIIGQTYTNLEIILVDDGSPDKCPKICDEWAKKDQRIKVIHKKNGGLSDARNAGMKIVTGDYIAFVDSDDWIHVQMYQRMVHLLEKTDADVCECNIKKANKKVDNICFSAKETGQVLTKLECLYGVIEQTVQPVVWNKIYRREIVDNLQFKKGKYNEDEFWTYLALDRITKMVQLDEELYYYFYREDSIINETYSLRRLDGLEARYKRMNYLKKYPDIYGKAKRNLVFDCMYHYQKGLSYLSKSEQYELRQRVEMYFKNISINKIDFKKYSIKEKIWFLLGKISLKQTCRLRNKLGYGVN